MHNPTCQTIVNFMNMFKAEEILSKKRYLAGNRLTEADVRLFVTLIRFDVAYHGHFKVIKILTRMRSS